MVYLKKHVDEDGNEYIWASDIFETMGEFEPKAQEAYQFLTLVERKLNYFTLNSATAFGNPEYNGYDGMVVGYCMAKGWDWDERNGEVWVRKGNRTLFRIEVPGLSEAERENRREIAELRTAMGMKEWG